MKYKVIYADPPWAFKTYSKKGMSKAAENHYDTMRFSDIKALPVNEWADDDCVLLIWTTGPFLEKSFEVINAWGFVYKTVSFTWIKTNRKSSGFFKGMGYWTRSNPEFCLLATKGKPKRKSKNVNELVIEPLREHSRKPDRIYDDIEDLLDGPYLELFARTTRLGWDQWGNQTNLYSSVSLKSTLF